MDANTVAMISQIEISNKMPTCKLNDCSSPAKMAKATMLFSNERIPIICDRALLRLIIKKSDKNIVESAIESNVSWAGMILVSGANIPEKAMAKRTARTINVVGALR